MLPVFVFALFIILVDLYAWKGLHILFNKPHNNALKVIFRTLYWLIPFLLIASVVFVMYFRPVEPGQRIVNRYYYIVAFTMVFYLPKLVFILFHLVEDIVHISEKAVRSLIKYLKKDDPPFGETNAGRRKFLSRTGIIIAIIPFLAVIYGVAIGRFDFQVINKSVEFENLPPAFDGFRIAHISDLHTGSFHGYENRVRQAVELINRQEADVIVFTGDLVNYFTTELDGFIEILSEMSAPFGMYSVLGNHDYGDYYQWESEAAKQKNMRDMLAAQEEIGFQLLMNEWDTISISGETIVIAGVENWGEPPFPRYGDLEKALEGTEKFPFIILLTHDPIHWDAEVLDETNIDLTLAGHTHGMQFGIETRFLRWSPIRHRYPRWGGLYRENNQFLYVNRGLGYVAFPGRIGMPPEITVIELQRSR